MNIVFSIINQKGGVDKTTTSTNLLTISAITNKGNIDLDTQGNSSTKFGITYEQRINTIYEVLINHLSAIIKTKIPNLHLLSSTAGLSAARIELIQIQQRESILKNFLSEVKNSYDYIFIYCPQSLELLTVNAVMISIQYKFFALERLSHLIKIIELIKKHLKTLLSIERIILPIYDKRSKLSKQQVEEDVRKML